MTNYSLSTTGGTDIQTTFRFMLTVVANSALGLSEDITAYIVSTDLPSASGEPIIWHLPGGMKNHQAGKRTPKPINMEFVTPTNSASSWYKVLEKWSMATYNLNTGTNAGKTMYCYDNIYIKILGEDNIVKYQFRMLKAQPTDVNYGNVNSESSDLLKVSCTFIYDNYQLTDGNGVLLSSKS